MALSWSVLLFIILVASITDQGIYVNAQTLLPPLRQLEPGIMPDVKCKENFVLIIKESNGNPACVRPQTAQKLVERGWGTIVTSLPNSTPTCPTGKTMVDGKCVSIPVPTTMQACNGDSLIPYSYALPCTRPNPTCPSGMTFSKGVCVNWGFTPPPPPVVDPNCVPSSNKICQTGIAYPSCGGSFNGNECEPGSISCPTGLQGDTFGTTCNYSPPKCSTGYNVTKISAGSYSCQPADQPPLSNPADYLSGQKVGTFTISKINQYNVTGYYNNPYPIERPGLGYFVIMHVGDRLNPSCEGSASLVITAINYPNSIKVSVGKPSGIRGGCPICLSENSLIKTPTRDVNVKDIKDGMTVWSTNSNGTIIKSNVIKINKVFVGDAHTVIDLQLDDGRELFVSPSHPTYDGRIIADLKAGEKYDGSMIKSIELVQYKYQFTYDILPDSQTGNYFANGILVGSTLK